ncbi:MAG TPA: hypothetical protein VM487_18545 [Phycisphaerae bacterium]|nr:hypothetical protein [Phycisphaerae bacterium]
METSQGQSLGFINGEALTRYRAVTKYGSTSDDTVGVCGTADPMLGVVQETQATVDRHVKVALDGITKVEAVTAFDAGVYIKVADALGRFGAATNLADAQMLSIEAAGAAGRIALARFIH